MTDPTNVVIPIDTLRARHAQREVRVLLIGPFDPNGGEYTFLAPPLGVWRLAGVLEQAGVQTHVFDPNCCIGIPEISLTALLERERWDVIGVSTTGMTLPYDLALAHIARRLQPHARLVAGGMEATFDAERVLTLGPFDLVVLGEGEEPLKAIVERLRGGRDLQQIPGTAWRSADGTIRRVSGPALTRDALKTSIFLVPYAQMPYADYWERLEHSYQVAMLPIKADREAHLAEIRSVRLVTLNYCPMGCAFCSSTNFLNAAQGSTAKVARLDAAECLLMIQRIVDAHPNVRTIIFQDDIFVFRNDNRILPLCDAIVDAKKRGEIPSGLQFISTNRIDAMTPVRLTAMRRAGFRVLGFGIESFSLASLREFNKTQIHPFIMPVLDSALSAGITPFLDMILTSPRCRLDDLAENVREGFRWILAGCEVGMYPYVIPFSGAAMAADATLRPATVYETRRVAGTDVSWEQATKILPFDPAVRAAILAIEATYEDCLAELTAIVPHLPSRLRSLLWILSAAPELERRGCHAPPREMVARALLSRLPRSSAAAAVVLSRAVHRRAS